MQTTLGTGQEGLGGEQEGTTCRPAMATAGGLHSALLRCPARATAAPSVAKSGRPDWVGAAVVWNGQTGLRLAPLHDATRVVVGALSTAATAQPGPGLPHMHLALNTDVAVAV